MSARASALLLALGALSSCDVTEPSSPAPDGAVALVPPAEYAVWFSRTEGCAGLSGRFEAIQWLVVPGVETFPTDRGPKVGMWERRDGRDVITLAGNYTGHEMVVRHEMLHSLIGEAGHPDRLFTEQCRLTWETWGGA